MSVLALITAHARNDLVVFFIVLTCTESEGLLVDLMFIVPAV